MAPLLQRLTWLTWLAKVTPLRFFEGLPKVRAWCDALIAKPPLVASTRQDVEARAHASFCGYTAKMRNAHPP